MSLTESNEGRVVEQAMAVVGRCHTGIHMREDRFSSEAKLVDKPYDH